MTPAGTCSPWCLPVSLQPWPGTPGCPSVLQPLRGLFHSVYQQAATRILCFQHGWYCSFNRARLFLAHHNSDLWVRYICTFDAEQAAVSLLLQVSGMLCRPRNSPALRLFLPPCLEFGHVQLALTVELKMLAQGFYTRSSNDPLHTSGLNCLDTVCALPFRWTCSNRVFSSFHLLIWATPLKCSSQLVKLPLLLKASGMAMASADYANVSWFHHCAQKPSQLPQYLYAPCTCNHSTKTVGSSKYICRCVCPPNKGCCLGTKQRGMCDILPRWPY